MKFFGKNQVEKPSELVVAEPVPAAPEEPKFKSFDADDYRAKSLSAKYELEISLKDGATLRVTREVYASARRHQLSLLSWDVEYLPATEFDLHDNLRQILKSIGKDGLFLGGGDKYLNESTIYQAGQFIPPANIASIAYRKVEEL